MTPQDNSDVTILVYADFVEEQSFIPGISIELREELGVDSWIALRPGPMASLIKGPSMLNMSEFDLVGCQTMVGTLVPMAMLDEVGGSSVERIGGWAGRLHDGVGV